MSCFEISTALSGFPGGVPKARPCFLQVLGVKRSEQDTTSQQNSKDEQISDGFSTGRWYLLSEGKFVE